MFHPFHLKLLWDRGKDEEANEEQETLQGCADISVKCKKWKKNYPDMSVHKTRKKIVDQQKTKAKLINVVL